MHIRVGIFYLAGFPLTIVYTTQRDMLIKERKEGNKNRRMEGLSMNVERYKIKNGCRPLYWQPTPATLPENPINRGA